MTVKNVKAVVRLRIYPNQEQEKLLTQFCGTSRWVYNWALNRCKQRREEGQSTSAYDLAGELVFLKKMEATAWIKTTQAAGLQQTLLSLEKAFKYFFKGICAYPKPKIKGHRDSFSFPQHVTYDSVNRKLNLPKIGIVKCSDQEFSGALKTVTVVREGDGWYACIRTTKAVQILSKGSLPIGIDVGVAKMATFITENDHGRHFDHHPGLDKVIERIKLLGSQLSRKQRKDGKNSKNREKARRKLAKAHTKLSNMRRDHLHKVSTVLVKTYKTIVVEDLKIKNMTKRSVGTLEEPNLRSAAKRGMNRVIRKQAWGVFFSMLEYKCDWYGRTFIKVDPKNTSRTCPQCGHIAKENRESQAVFRCVACKHTANADHVGALNVLRRGLSSLAPTPA